MADGMMILLDSDVQPLAETFPYSPEVPTMGWNIEGMGAVSCDRRMSQEKERLVPFRYDIGCFRGVRNAGTGALEFAPTTITLFASGLGEAATPNGFLAGTKSTADSNAMPGGGAVRDGQIFIQTGFIVQLMEPWVVAALATNLLTPRTFPHWLSLPDTGYAKKILQSVPEAVSFVVSHGDNACKYNLGAMSMWAGAGGVAQVQTSGADSIGGQFWYLAVPDVSGAKNNTTQLNIACTLNSAITIPSFAANPTIAEFDALCPFRIWCVGFPVCLNATPGGACAPGAPREVNALFDKRMERMERAILSMAESLGNHGNGNGNGDRNRKQLLSEQEK